MESNTEKRRTVIGQLIDYTSAVRQEGRSGLEQYGARGGVDLSDNLDPEALEELRSRIESGTIGLCWVVDRIDDELRRLIEYLSTRSLETGITWPYSLHAGGTVAMWSSLSLQPMARDRGSQGVLGIPRLGRDKGTGFVDAVAALDDPAESQFLTRLLELVDVEENRRGGGRPAGPTKKESSSMPMDFLIRRF